MGQIANISISEEYQKYRDSLMETPYEWHFPILGSKLRKMGFDLPYPNGIGVNYAWSRQNINISNAYVGFDSDNLIGIDGIARFRKIQADVNAVNVRYDFWLLPFLNFYGIAGRINSQTEINLGLPFDLTFNTNNNGTGIGWGTVVAGGVGPLVLSGDFTMVWTFMKNLDQPSKTIVLGGRGGYMFRFPKRPDRNLVVLVGAQYLGISKGGSGTVDLEKLVGITPEKKAAALNQLNDWYDELPDSEQEVLFPIYDGASRWLSSNEPVELKYRFDKTMYYPVSMSLGVNMQINKRYTFTGIYSFLGSRQQVVFGLGYRFGIKGNNFLSGLTL
ncbi:hypothetical protein KFZ70_03125 [Tamlana fucoidanivorans]|uniref:Uncharacterized protein n=2 Tax=Allotamlana fucoidanivorans TaxID=2583814 RepID=A0A5C4SLM0_9FLAO|nr:hypothetical protein FGF67_09795 [Tamlana fucoidanivorans]